MTYRLFPFLKDIAEQAFDRPYEIVDLNDSPFMSEIKEMNFNMDNDLQNNDRSADERHEDTLKGKAGEWLWIKKMKWEANPLPRDKMNFDSIAWDIQDHHGHRIEVKYFGYSYVDFNIKDWGTLMKAACADKIDFVAFYNATKVDNLKYKVRLRAVSLGHIFALTPELRETVVKVGNNFVNYGLHPYVNEWLTLSPSAIKYDDREEW
jgi:hypothetical protein